MSENKNLLVNKFIFISTGEYYKYGQIIECVDSDEQYFLVRIFSREDGGPDTTCATLYHIDQMVQADEEPDTDGVIWSFFNTKRELDKYIKWVETPSLKSGQNKVVNLSLVRSQNGKSGFESGRDAS